MEEGRKEGEEGEGGALYQVVRSGPKIVDGTKSRSEAAQTGRDG
jgi:hypothetical protein